MNKFITLAILALGFFLSSPAEAQQFRTSTTDPSGSCSTDVVYNQVTGVLWGCRSQAWSQVGGAGVIGPGTSINGDVVCFNGTTGAIIATCGFNGNNVAALNTGNNWGGPQNMAAVTQLTLPTSPTATTPTTATIAYDLTANQLHTGINNTDRVIPYRATTTPTSGNCVQWGANGILGEASAACGSGGGSGTVVVVGGGTVTNTALVTGGGSQAIQTPSATATLDTSGNLSTPGTVSSGAGGSNGGYFQGQQGAAPSIVANNVQIVAPAAVTGYQFILPGVSATGVLLGTNSANVNTITFKGLQGTDTNILTAGTISGTAQPLCTTANGGATTSGCPAGGGGSETVNPQTGTTYTVLTGDNTKLVTLSNTSAIAVTLPPGGASFPSGWYVDVQNIGTNSNGVATITTSATIDGSATLVLSPKQGVRLVSDGTNYFTVRGLGMTYLAGFTATTQQYATFQNTNSTGSPTVANGFLGYTGNGQTISSTAFAGAPLRTITFSATPTIDLSSGNLFTITLTGNVTSSTWSNPTSGQEFRLIICQDGTGSRTFAFPATFKGATIPPASATLSTCSVQSFVWNGTNYYATAIGSNNI